MTGKSSEQGPSDQPDSNPPGASADAETEPKSAGRKWLKRIGFFLYLFVLFELGARAYFCFSRDVSFFAPNMTYVFYSELQPLDEREELVSRDDETVDVLLLGGSVLNKGNGDIAIFLKKMLAEATGQPVAIHNVAMPGHTSRDSLNKYRHLTQHRFDLVLFYHSINDARMNNCPPEFWKDDYMHTGWHARLNAIDQHPELPYVVTPYAAQYGWIKVFELNGWGGLIPSKRLVGRYLKHGDNIRSDRSYLANIREVMQIAETRGDPLMMATFVLYFPDGYDHDLPGDGQMPGVDDYAGNQGSYVELFGKSAHVEAAVERHNRLLREEWSARPRFGLVDVAQQFPREGRHYLDVCHFTESGSRQYVQLVLPKALELLGRSE